MLRTSMSASKPNILFLITHDVGPVYGCYGRAGIHTPHIDALADESLVFDSHYCHWPLCGPARANLFTGCRPLTTQRFNNQPFFRPFRERMGPHFASLPQHFKNQGYETSAVGFVFHDEEDPPSWSMGHWRPPTSEMLEGASIGFRDGLPARIRGQWQGSESLQLIRERWERLQKEGFTPVDLEDPQVERAARGPAVDAAPVDDRAYHGGQVAARAVQLIRDLPNDKPFFLAAGFIDSHLPFWAPQKYWDLYDRRRLSLPAFRDLPAGSPAWAMGDSEPAQYYTTHGYEKPWRANEDQSLELLHGRYAVLSYFDALVGTLLSALKDTGKDSDTIVILTSDHGFHEGEHGYWGKHNLWERSLHVPLLIKPVFGDLKAIRIKGLTEHVDVYPTLCAMAGVPSPSQLQEGISLVPLLEGSADEMKSAVFAHRKPMWHDRIQAYDMAHTVRTSRYRFTRYLDASQELVHSELFDYAVDPEEKRNFSSATDYAAAKAEVEGLLDGLYPLGSEILAHRTNDISRDSPNHPTPSASA